MLRRKVFLRVLLSLIVMSAVIPWLTLDANAAPLFLVFGLLGQEVKVSPTQTPTDADRFLPAVAYNSQHQQYLAVWHNQWSGSRDIYGQRLGRNGALEGPWFAISYGANDRMAPAVTYNATNDEYLVVYMYDLLGDGTRFDIMAQRVNWDGNLIGSPFQIITYADRTFDSPKVVWNNDANEYLIVWHARVISTGLSSDIAMKIISPTGAEIYTTILSSVDSPSDPDVVWNTVDNRYLVVWNYTNTYGKSAVMGDLRDFWGNRIGGITNPFTIFSASGISVIHPRAAFDGTRFASIYEYIFGATDHDIHLTWLNSDGSGYLSQIVANTDDNETLPAVASNPGRQEIGVLFQLSTVGTNQIWLRLFSNSAPPDFIEVCGSTNRDCINPEVAWGSSGYLLAYSSQFTTPPASKIQVYARLFSPEAVFLPAVAK